RRRHSFPTRRSSDLAAANWVHVFSPRLINEARLGFNRFRLDYVAEGVTPDVPLGNLLGVKNSNTGPLQSALPIFSPANYQGTGQDRKSTRLNSSHEW